MEVLVTGDFCPQCRVAELFDKSEFDTVLGEVKPIIEHVDYSIVNFECPVTTGDEKPIEKYGPNIQCTEKGMEAVKWAGFDCVTLANNHFLDFGEGGVNHTLEACKKYGIDSVGGGLDLHEASQILYKKIDGKTLAVVNCCEHEFSIATETTAGSNPLNPIKQYYAILEAKKNADFILVIVHGGHEHYQLPSPRMQETYRFFIDAGADAVVNHHQHCYSGYEMYKEKPIFYGLGNFCFDKPNYFEGLWEYGYMVKLQFAKSISFDIIPYKQCKERPTIALLKDQASFNNQLLELNTIISDKQKLLEQTAIYYKNSSEKTHFAFEPYYGKILMKLYMMHTKYLLNLI